MPHAIQIHAFGGPEQMQGVDLPVGEPGPGEILIRHHACGLNFIDVYQRTGLYPNPLPLTLGMEGAGVVEAVGEGVTHLAAGDRAAYAANAPGAYCELRVMPAKNVVRLPDAIDFETAAAMMLKGLTAQYLLKKTRPVEGLDPGDFVLFHAAAGGVGLIACQWAKALRLQLIATAGSAAKCRLALEHGAAHAIDYSKEDFVARVKDITGGKGVKVVYDSVGKDTWEGSLNCLRPLRPDGHLRQRQRPGAALRAGDPGCQGLAVRDAADALHAHRHARGHAGDGRRTVRGGGQRRGEDPHRPALPAGRGGTGAPRAGGAQDDGLHSAVALSRPWPASMWPSRR
jgi:NADPH:quinone reductase